MKILLSLLIFIMIPFIARSQTVQEQYEQFKNSAFKDYSSFRVECNQNYADFLRASWDWFEGNSPVPMPDDKKPVPPKPYQPIKQKPVLVEPKPIQPVESKPQPKPFSPIKEIPNPAEVAFQVNFYGITSEVRLPEIAKKILNNISPGSIGEAWISLCTEEMDNAIRDCLETRVRYNLCDWAYLQFLKEMALQYCPNRNSATFLTAYLYCQSGYQMRLGEDNGNLVLLIGSHHQIYDMPYYLLDGTAFYPLGETSGNIRICNAEFESETPLSLDIHSEMQLGSKLSQIRTIKSKGFSEVEASSKIPEEIIKFYNEYPTSIVHNNPLTRWALYANAPLAQATKSILYPSLKKSIEGDSNLEAVNKLLNWVQTGFVYEYDDKVWGHDRAFFAEETLYYPFADCEDRSILFSRLVRDLLGLDVALIYYPGHLATAVKFDTDVSGDAMLINGDRYTVCDPTYIGAPVGAQMPDLEYDKAQAIVLN